MKKLITVITSLIVIAAAGKAAQLHSKADMKVETADFSVSSDRSHRPSAYCRMADGSPVGENISTSENFCISGMADGNMSLLTYDGLPAYCIGLHTQNAPTALMQVTKLSDIPYNSDEYGAVFRMAAAGASTGTTAYGLSDTDLYYVTQCAVRCYLYGTGSENLAFFDDNGNLNTDMTNEFHRISSAAYETYIPYEPVLTIDQSAAYDEKTFTDDKCFFRYGPFYVYSEYTDIPGYSISASETDGWSVITPLSELTDTESVYEYTADTPFYVYINSAYEEEIALEITSEKNVTRYDPTVYLAGSENCQDIFQLRITSSDETMYGNIILKNTDTTGDLKVSKHFMADNTEISDKYLISQPRFAIKNEKDKYISGIQSDSKIVFDHFSEEPVEYALSSASEIYVSGLPVGEYRIFEIQGASGFEARETEVMIYNSVELDVCDFINESITTTTVTTPAETTTTATETTTGTETSATSVTVPETFTVTVTEETFGTDITEYFETETVSESTAEESEEYSQISLNTPSVSVPRVPGTPKTGDNRFPVSILIPLMTLSASIALKFRKC